MPATQPNGTQGIIRADGGIILNFKDASIDAVLEQLSEVAGFIVVKETKPEVRTLLLIGHNPGLHDAARLLIASGDVEARERLNEGLPTSGLAVIDFAGKDWRKLHPSGGRLVVFVSPRSLAAADRV